MKKTNYDAPDMEVQLSDRARRRMRSFWQDRPVALVFLRHFGCPFARSQVAQLRREQEGLSKAGIDVVLVGSGSNEQAESFRQECEVPFQIVCDPDCVLFKKYGLRDMDPRDWYSPLILLKVVKVLIQGYGHKPGQGSRSQLPGAFIIDQGGKVRFAHQAVDATYNIPPER